MACSTSLNLTIDQCPDYVKLVFPLGSMTAYQTLYYTYTDHHGAVVSDSAIISTTGDATGYGHILIEITETEKAKFITGQSITFAIQETDGGDDIMINCTGIIYSCMVVVIGTDTSSGTETITYECPCNGTEIEPPTDIVTLCDQIEACTVITTLQSDVNAVEASVTTLQADMTAAEAAITALQSSVSNKQDKSVEVTASLTAANDQYYINTASATYTDPTPSAGHGFIVLVRNGTATIGGTGYSTAGQIIYRYYHSGAWASYVVEPQNVNTLGAIVNGAASATPNDSDLVMSVESSVAKKNTWTQIKAFLKTYFDTIYTTLAAVSTGLSYDRVIGQTTQQVTVAAASGETKAWSTLITGNSLKTSSVLHFFGLMTASGAATITMRWYANTIDSLSGATLLGTYQATGRFAMVRNIIMNNSLTVQKMMLSASGTASVSDEGVAASGLTMASAAVDFTANQYIVLSIQASANNALLEMAHVIEHRI